MSTLPFGWRDTIKVTPEKTKAAKAWWSSLSINEQKAFKLKHLGPNWPNELVYTKDGQQLILMWEAEGSPINFINQY